MVQVIFFFRCEEVHLFLLHYSLIFLNGNPEYNVCLLLLEIGRMQIHVHVHGGLLCQSELRCMGLIRPWFCSKSAALALLSICYVIHVFFYAYQLLCSWMPSKGSKNLPQKRRGFFSFPIHLWGETSGSMQLSETKESSLLSQRVLKCVLNI